MSGTNKTLDIVTGGPVIILVEPQLGENIGMVARAMANFGLSELRLVNPRDGWPSEKARAAASRADDAWVVDTAQRMARIQASEIAEMEFARESAGLPATPAGFTPDFGAGAAPMSDMDMDMDMDSSDSDAGDGG